LCTANLCRSPIAEAVFTAQLAQRGVPAQVRSAGFLKAGQHSPPEVAEVLGRWGLGFSRRESREVSVADLAQADLILCMERSHVREAVVLNPTSWPRTFTLKELVRRASDTFPRAREESVNAWLARIHAERERSSLLGASPIDDVADPYGKKISAYEATLTELVGLTGRLIERIWPPDQPAID
jgi:protein-tyrosine phosphatase